LEKEELIEERLLGFRQFSDGTIQPCPLEHLLLLTGNQITQPLTGDIVVRAADLLAIARDRITKKLSEN
jgi:hypothetical protein